MSTTAEHGERLTDGIATAPRVQLAATRTRKARTRSRCPLCRGGIVTGVLIGLLPGLGWVHVACIITARQHDPVTVIRSEVLGQLATTKGTP